MNRIGRCIFAGLFLAAAGMAQISTPIIPVGVDQVYTTGMISFTTSQTAQLNVLNVAPVPSTAAGTTNTTPACSVQLSYYDAQNRLVKQGAVTTIAPQTAITLDLTTSQVPAASVTTPRIAIRGVVKVEPPATTTGASSAVVFASSCQLITTLELFDSVSGLTESFSSDTRLVTTSYVIPLAISNHE
ncbi:MAG TPA: hypothetical protein VML19_26075 [Verrucomicrobiae bacterium]|nr:hypothetical protein [Verrucomicrobiae bacterium]